MHGWNDAVVPPDGSIDYTVALALWEQWRDLAPAEIDRRIAALTLQEAAAAAETAGPKVRTYHRLFMLPATGHCGGSTGPNAIGGGMPEPPKALRDADHHAVSAVVRWVEQGVAPEQIVATKFDAAGKPLRSRPVCAYPAEAVYKGSGSIDDASNFGCRVPPPAERALRESDLVLIRNALSQRTLMLPNR